MLTIRLSLRGKKNRRTYRIVASEARSKLDGKFTFDLGSFCPQKNTLELKEALYLQLIAKGAKPSPSVEKIIALHKK